MKARSRAEWLELVKALDELGARTGEFAAERGLNPRTPHVGDQAYPFHGRPGSFPMCHSRTLR